MCVCVCVCVCACVCVCVCVCVCDWGDGREDRVATQERLSPFEGLLQTFVLQLVAAYILDDAQQDGLEVLQQFRVFPGVQLLV